MNRRSFIKRSLVAGVAVSVVPGYGFSLPDDWLDIEWKAWVTNQRTGVTFFATDTIQLSRQEPITIYVERIPLDGKRSNDEMKIVVETLLKEGHERPYPVINHGEWHKYMCEGDTMTITAHPILA